MGCQVKTVDMKVGLALGEKRVADGGKGLREGWGMNMTRMHYKHV